MGEMTAKGAFATENIQFDFTHLPPLHYLPKYMLSTNELMLKLSKIVSTYNSVINTIG